MARVITTHDYCDSHLQHDEQVPAHTYVVSLTMPGSKPVTFEVDLCTDCSKTLTDLEVMLQAVGARESYGKRPKAGHPKPRAGAAPTSDAATGDGFDCPACGDHFRVRSTLLSHARRDHGKSLTELQLGPAPWTCPDCPEGQAPEPFTDPRALGAHRVKAHGTVA